MIFEEILRRNIKFLKRKINWILFLGVTGPALASTTLSMSGFKQQVYVIREVSSVQYLCEHNQSFVENWCVKLPHHADGIFVGFKQVLTYSDQLIASYNPLTSSFKWSIPLERMHKIHINFPVIITMNQSRELIGYDFFTGIQLWTIQTSAKTFYEIDRFIWLVQDGELQRIDAYTADIRQTIPFRSPVHQLYGDGTNLFLNSEGVIMALNTVNLTQRIITKNMTIMHKVSDYLVLKDSQGDVYLLDRSMTMISTHANESDTFILETSRKAYIAKINNNRLGIYTKYGVSEYAILEGAKTPQYGYKINDTLHVMYTKGSDIWTLEKINKESFGTDTQ